VKVANCAVSGVPEMLAVLPSRVMLCGKFPELTLQTKGATPPAACIAWLYGKATIPSTNPAVAIDNFGPSGGGGVLAPRPQFDSRITSIQMTPIRMGERHIVFRLSLVTEP
jgi:hypothetical protein